MLILSQKYLWRHTFWSDVMFPSGITSILTFHNLGFSPDIRALFNFTSFVSCLMSFGKATLMNVAVLFHVLPTTVSSLRMRITRSIIIIRSYIIYFYFFCFCDCLRMVYPCFILIPYYHRGSNVRFLPQRCVVFPDDIRQYVFRCFIQSSCLVRVSNFVKFS